MNYHESIREYVFEHLDVRLTSGEAPEKLNVFTDFRSFFSSKGGRALLVDEFLDRQGMSLTLCLQDYIAQWERLFIPPPIELTSGGQTVITYRHSKFEQITGRPCLPLGFGALHDWVRGQSEKEFLFVCALELSVMGASSVFITDTSGDEGIDVIAHFGKAPFTGITIFVQAKTSNSAITRDVLLAEYGKYCLGRLSSRFSEYRRALGVDCSGCGQGPIYCVMANVEFKENAKRVARELGVLLRSRKQLAFSLAKRFALSKVQSLRSGVGALDANLTRDLAGILSRG